MPNRKESIKKGNMKKAYSIFIPVVAVLCLIPYFVHRMCVCPEQLLIACAP